MAITGTSTGPFTITGTESTLSIYNYVVAQDVNNATKNSDNTQFDFNCNLFLGNGTTSTTWTSNEQQVRIDSTSFEIRTNATLNIGAANPARAGSSWRWQNTAAFQLSIAGNLNCNASRIYMSHAAVAASTAVINFTECTLALIGSISNEEGVSNPTVTYTRCFLAGANVGVKLGGNVLLTGCKISQANFAMQPLNIAGSNPIYTIVDYVAQANTNDAIPNLSGTIQLNVVGAFDQNGVPRTGLVVVDSGIGRTVRLQWRYNLISLFNNTGEAGTNVRIRNNAGTQVFSGQTDVNGEIPQQILNRVEYINNSVAQNRFPYEVKLRKYDKTSIDLVYNADNHRQQQGSHVLVPFLSLTQSEAAALTGITFTPSGTSSGTVTIGENHSVSNLWASYRNWISETSNFNSNDSWTYDGSLINLGDWDIIINASITLTGNVTTTGIAEINGVLNGTITSDVGTRVIIKTSDNIDLSTEILLDGVPQGWVTGSNNRTLLVNSSSVVNIYAHAYGYQPKLITIIGNTPSDYVLTLLPEVNVDISLNSITRDAIAFKFSFGVDAFSRVFLSVSDDLRQYTPAETLNALHYYVVNNGEIISLASLQANTVDNFAIKRGGVIIRSPGFYGKVSNSITTVSALGILVPLSIEVDSGVYDLNPSYTPVEKNSSDIVLQFAPWTQQEADVPSWVAQEVTSQQIKGNTGLIPGLF